MTLPQGISKAEQNVRKYLRPFSTCLRFCLERAPLPVGNLLINYLHICQNAKAFWNRYIWWREKNMNDFINVFQIFIAAIFTDAYFKATFADSLNSFTLSTLKYSVYQLFKRYCGQLTLALKTFSNLFHIFKTQNSLNPFFQTFNTFLCRKPKLTLYINWTKTMVS